jgi:hypothetical protein
MNFAKASTAVTVAAAATTIPSASRLARANQSTARIAPTWSSVVATPKPSESGPARSRETAAVDPLTISASYQPSRSAASRRAPPRLST